MRKKLLMFTCTALAGSIFLTGCGTKETPSEKTEIILEEVTEAPVTTEWKYEYLDNHNFTIYGGRAALECIIDVVNATLTGDTESVNEDYFAEITAGGHLDEISVIRAEDSEKLVAIFQDHPGMHHVYTTMLTSFDNGDTWNIKMESVPSSDCYDLLYFKNYIVLLSWHAVTEQGALKISYNNGDSFTTYNYVNLYNQGVTEKHDGEGITAELISFDEAENTIRLKWFDRFEKKYLYTADYDLIGNLKEIVSFENGTTTALEILKKMKDPETYIFTDSHERYLTAEEIEELCLAAVDEDFEVKALLRNAINEIYARKGFDFTGTKFYETYLKNKLWYKPIPQKTVTEEELNPFEKANIDLLVSFEKSELIVAEP